MRSRVRTPACPVFPVPTFSLYYSHNPFPINQKINQFASVLIYWTAGVTQVVELLQSKHEALSSNLSAANKLIDREIISQEIIFGLPFPIWLSVWMYTWWSVWELQMDSWAAWELTGCQRYVGRDEARRPRRSERRPWIPDTIGQKTTQDMVCRCWGGYHQLRVQKMGSVFRRGDGKVSFRQG
jgi:hypothetical protein